jgi:hypothetical protein
VIARSVLGAVGRAVDWSLIRALGAVSERVEGRGAGCYRRADALADMEAAQEVWESRQLAQVWCCCDHDKTLQPCGFCRLDEHDRCAASFLPGRCDEEGVPCTPICPGCVKDWPAEPSSHGFSGECPADGSSCGCGRSAAVTIPAADNTTRLRPPRSRLELPHRAQSDTRRCGPAGWSGSARAVVGPGRLSRPNARHRFQVLADMKNATERIQEQLAESTNACVVDGCDFWWHTYEQLNSHSRQMHLEPNPLPAGGFRYPGADHVGDFTWHHVPTHRIQEQLGGAS